MGGPRITSGPDSDQDYKTPADFMAAVTERWGAICFDLAAHVGNAQHERYFAPAEFVWTGTLDEISHRPGLPVPLFSDSKRQKPKVRSKTKEQLYEKRVDNSDLKAYGLDAFAHSWADLSLKFAIGDRYGLLWLNCEFDDTERWARRCREEAKKGAHILLLSPVAITNWFRDSVQGIADTSFLLGRLSFDGKNPYPKDCMLSYFHPGAGGSGDGRRVELWDWRAAKICGSGSWTNWQI